MNSTTEIVARDAFIDALDDRQLSLRVREKEPTTLEKAPRIAIRFEAYAGAADEDRVDDGRHDRPRQIRGAAVMSSETDSLTSKIRQMEADRRKSDERIRQLEAALQSHAHLTAPSPNVPPVHGRSTLHRRRFNRHQSLFVSR